MGRAVRRACGALLVCGLLATALAFYTYAPYLNLTVPAGAVTPAAPAAGTTPTATRAEPEHSPTARAGGSPTLTTAPTAEAPNDDRPPDLDGGEPGIRLVATVLAGGVFDVTETVRLPAPVTRLSLVPLDLRPAGGSLRSAHASVTDLVVDADDRSVRLPRRNVHRATTVVVGRATDRFEVRYRLHGTVRVSRPSRAGRALGAVGPLVSGVGDDLPVAMSFPGEAVSNLRCASLPVDQEACFAGRRPNVRVNRNLRHRDALVLVQLDLQRAPRGGR